jgi:formylglycine-generating enzyme required for sulfatase activity
VSWYEAAQFVNWLNTSKGHQAAYKFTGTQGTNNYTFDTWSTAEADGTNLFRHKDAFYYLPTDDEWIKAAYWNGTSLQTHATPDDTVPVAGTDTNYAQPAPYADGPWDVGSGIEELNGTFDIMGNLWEFVESPYSSGNYDPGTNRNMRSGSFANNSDFISALIRSGISPDYGHNKYVGFRVAAEVPEPATMSLLAMGAVTLLRRKQR